MSTKLTILLLCLSAFCCFGQDDEKDEAWNLPNGFRVGYQWSNLVKDGDEAADNLDRFFVGYMRKFRLLHLLKMETGLEYMIAGAKQSEDSQLQLHYFVIPAEGMVKLGPFISMAGLSGNIKIGDKTAKKLTIPMVKSPTRSIWQPMSEQVSTSCSSPSKPAITGASSMSGTSGITSIGSWV